MNYYNPYLGFYPYVSAPAKAGLFSSLFKGGKLSLGSIVAGTQKTLGVINQAIPVIRQVSPVVKNAKTMFKVMNEFKKTDTPKNTKEKVKQTNKVNENINQDNFHEEITEKINDDGPTFFI